MNYIYTPGVHSGVRFEGPVTYMVPGIILDNCRIEGTHREDILLTMHHHGQFNNSVAIGSPNGAHRGINVNCRGWRVTRSRVLNVFHDIQTNGIAGWEGCADGVVEDCDIEASGQNIIYGGSYCGHADLIPQDIVHKNLTLLKPERWLKDPTVTVVNHFEIKNGKRIKATNVRAQGCRPGGGQDGSSILLTVRQDPPPYCCVEDIELSDWDIEDVEGGIQILGHDDMFPPPQDGYGLVERVLLKNLHFRRLKDNARQIHINSGSKNLTIQGMTVFESALTNSFITFSNMNYINENLTVTGCNVPSGRYGIIGDGLMGQDALDQFAPGCVFTDNVIRDEMS